MLDQLFAPVFPPLRSTYGSSAQHVDDDDARCLVQRRGEIEQNV